MRGRFRFPETWVRGVSRPIASRTRTIIDSRGKNETPLSKPPFGYKTGWIYIRENIWKFHNRRELASLSPTPRWWPIEIIFPSCIFFFFSLCNVESHASWPRDSFSNYKSIINYQTQGYTRSQVEMKLGSPGGGGEFKYRRISEICRSRRIINILCEHDQSRSMELGFYSQ